MMNRKSLCLSDDFIRWKGGKLRLLLVQSSIIQFILYTFKLDILFNYFSKSWSAQIEQSLKKFLTDEELMDNTLIKEIKDDINRCYRLIRAKPSEYFLYNLRNKTESEIKEYLTDKQMLYMLSIKGYRKIHDLELNDKYNFYLLASKYYKRDVMSLNSHTHYSDFEKFALKNTCFIVKPTYLGTGEGIFIGEAASGIDAINLYNKLMKKGENWIIEEIIRQSEKMSEFNKSSVNTIRVSTFKNKNGIFFHYPTIRTGREGSVVDNAGSGGITAVVDNVTGIIITDGYDEAGHAYVFHPDSGVQYKGWQVPNWKALLDVAKKLHNEIFYNHPYVGWDFAHTDSGWVIIEGNWGQYIGKQVCMKRGFRIEFMDLINGNNVN